jgi:GGDEF domain-containing protein
LWRAWQGAPFRLPFLGCGLNREVSPVEIRSDPNAERVRSMREAFGTEHGEEFMSLVYALDAEARGRDSILAHAAGGELERMLSGQATPQSVEPAPAPRIERLASLPPHRVTAAPRPLVPVAESVASMARQRPAPTGLPPRERRTVVPFSVRPASPEPARRAVPTHRSTLRPSTLVDELTGIGGPLALKRDVMLERSLPTPGGARFALISIDVHQVAEVRQRRGEAVADQLFKTLVDAIRISISPSDSVYRSGPDELTLLLRGRDPGAGDHARAELEAALREALADRGLLSVRLATATKGPHPVVAPREDVAV